MTVPAAPDLVVPPAVGRPRSGVMRRLARRKLAVFGFVIIMVTVIGHFSRPG